MASESMGLLQGTVDVLILKTLSAKPLHGYAISELIHERRTGISPSKTRPCIRRSTASSGKDLSNPSGESRTQTVARGFTRSAPPAASSCVQR